MTGAALSGRSVLVTGASSGIGLAVSRELASAGAWVGMVARTESRLREAALAVGGHPMAADISAAADVDRLVRDVEERLRDAPDILVNAAGAFSLAAFESATPEDFDRAIAANLRGPFLVIRGFLGRMKNRGTGHIVNIGSIAGRLALPGNAVYGASKFGLRGLHEILAAELQGTGIRTTLLEPAATDTPLWDELDPDNRTDLPSRGQMLQPEDVGRAVRYVVEQPARVEVTHLAIRAS